MSKTEHHELGALEGCGSTRLSNEAFDAFCRACANPPALSPEILEAARALDSDGLVVFGAP